MNHWARALLSDWQLKLLGLAIAVVLWAYVHGLQSLQLTLSVPLEFRNVPRSVRFARRPPATVEIRLEARRDVIPRLLPKSVKAVVDLTRQVSGRYVTITLTPDHILRPAGVEVLGINPNQLMLEFEPAGRNRGD